MESGVVGPNKLPPEVTFTPSVDKDCSTCGNSANIIAPDQPFVGTTASLRRRWLQLNKNGWCALPSVVKAQSLYGGRPRHQSLRGGVDFRDGGQGDLRRTRKTWRWERRFIIKRWFRIYQREGFQHFLFCFSENAALKMARMTDIVLDWLKEFLNLKKEKGVGKIWSQKPTMWALCPTSQCLNEHAASILWFWVNKTYTYIFCLNGSEIFMSANGIFFFVTFFVVARFSHDGLQETCHIAHACRSVLCGRDPPGGPKK